MTYIEKEGKTVEEAIALGLEQLGMDEDEVDIEVLKKGGLLAKAKVRLTVKTTPKDEACDYLVGLIERMGLDCEVELEEIEGGYSANVSGKDAASVIGYRGEVLDAIQYLATIYVNRNEKNYVKMAVDVEGYRGRRSETLRALACRLADKAVREGKKVDLEPMNNQDRRIIHETLVDDDRVTTESQGDEPNRYVTILPKEREVTYGTNKSFRTAGMKTRSFGGKKRRF
jgi:spoIIIJ-associated protein